MDSGRAASRLGGALDQARRESPRWSARCSRCSASSSCRSLDRRRRELRRPARSPRQQLLGSRSRGCNRDRLHPPRGAAGLPLQGAPSGAARGCATSSSASRSLGPLLLGVSGAPARRRHPAGREHLRSTATADSTSAAKSRKRRRNAAKNARKTAPSSSPKTSKGSAGAKATQAVRWRRSARKTKASNAIKDSGLSPLGQFAGLAGGLTLVIALFYTRLWAMRTGLLSRFWGSLGMAVGVAAADRPHPAGAALVLLPRPPAGRDPARRADRRPGRRAKRSPGRPRGRRPPPTWIRARTRAQAVAGTDARGRRRPRSAPTASRRAKRKQRDRGGAS